MDVHEHEAVVLGGGPAGSAAATLLARCGHDVALVRPSDPPSGELGESVPPSARRILMELGLLEGLEAARFQPNHGNTVSWAGASPRTESFGDADPGFHVDRVGLEEVLVREAGDAGATIYDGAVARSPEETGRGWRVRCDRFERAPIELGAQWVLDATGRRGLIATKEGREPDRSTTTVALICRWRRPGGFDGVDPTHTLVESYLDGWAWSVPLGPDVRCVAAMVDHRHVDLGGGDLDSKLGAELDKTVRMSAMRKGVQPCGPAWACSASLYTAARFGRPGLFLVGDAGSFIDPLSSYGIKKALSSGWLAGVATHTALIDPHMAETAVDLFDRRERRVYRRYRALAADFFEEGARTHGHEYWSRRAEAARVAGGGEVEEGAGSGIVGGRATSDWESAPLDPGASSPLPPREVRAAFDGIRSRDRLDAVRGSTLRRVRRAVVAGHRIRLEDHLASDRVPDGLRYVRGVDLRRVVDIAPEHPGVPDGWNAYNDEGPPVALPDYLSALSAAFAAGFLEHGSSGSS